MSAASPATCGDAMLVPALPRIKLKPLFAEHAVKKKWCPLSSTIHCFEQAAQINPPLPVRPPIPPGAAKLIAERPKLLYGARASTFVHGPVAPVAAVGAVADTQ